MDKVKKFNIILNIITICVYVIITIFTSWILIDYYFMEKTEGTGIMIALFYVINSFACIIQIILNIIGIGVIILNKDKVSYLGNNKLQYKKQLLMRVIMIIAPILTFIIQIIINNFIN